MFHACLELAICVSLRHLKLITIKSLLYPCKGYAEIQRKLEHIINRKVIIVLGGRAGAFAQYIILCASWRPRQRGREGKGGKKERREGTEGFSSSEGDAQILLYKQSGSADCLISVSM